MKIGTYYYPEQWPREQWARDLDNIADAGLQLVHLAEFAWHALEPAAGQFRFDWLDDVLAMCHERRLEVILCTPTAVVPQWLLAEAPEILTVDRHGSPQRVGGRRHYNPTSPALHDAATRIVGAMARHFGDRNGVVGWQLDNEYSAPFDQSPATDEAFRAWLKSRHGEGIGDLNAAWGNQFWRTDYTDWQQVRMPPARDPGYDNPHHHLDASRFWSAAFAQFNKLQCDLLRPHVGDRFLTHNFMPFHADVDPADLAGDLTVCGIDVYPVTGTAKHYADEAGLRTADPAFVGAAFDDMRSHTGRWGLLEVQPGQLNWSGVPVRLVPGAVRLMLWQAIAQGAEFITVYRWRTPTFGQEMHHDCLVRHDGTTLTAAGEEFKQVAAELKQVAAANSATYQPLVPASDLPTVGVVHDHEQQWWAASLPQARAWDQIKLLVGWHEAAGRCGLGTRRVSASGAGWDDLPIVVVPGAMLVDEAWPGRWRAWVEAGGHLVVTCRTAWYDRRGHVWEGPTAAPLVPLIGATIDAYDGLPAGSIGPAHVEMDGRRYPWHVWGEQLVPEAGTETWATYADQFYSGAAAVVSRAVGNGRVTHCGVYDAGEFALAVLRKAAMHAGLELADWPARTRHFRGDGLNIALNATAEPHELPAEVDPVLGARRLGPAEVAVWRQGESHSQQPNRHG